MGEPVLELRNVSFRYASELVLDDVSLRVERGDYLAVLGPNGSGKTTLLKVILGLLSPQQGSVRVLSRAPRAARGAVGYVPQRVLFDPDFPIRVLDVVLMGRLARRGLLRQFSAADREQAGAALRQVEIAGLADRAIGSLSGGELQRVLIARALALEPSLLLLDEPTASLDERMVRSIWELLEELSQHMAVVVVSHDVGAISHYVRSVACLNRRLFGHPEPALSTEVLEACYGCGVELLAHGQPHRVLPPHGGSGGSASGAGAAG